MADNSLLRRIFHPGRDHSDVVKETHSLFNTSLHEFLIHMISVGKIFKITLTLYSKQLTHLPWMRTTVRRKERRVDKAFLLDNTSRKKLLRTYLVFP
jgi:hypothetical protein